MKITKSKSTLKKKLEVEVSNRINPQPKAIILDGCAVLWVIRWPTTGTVDDFVKKSTCVHCRTNEDW